MSASNNSSPVSLQDTDNPNTAWIYHEWNQTTEQVDVVAMLPQFNRVVVLHSKNGVVELMERCKVFEEEDEAATAGWLAMMSSASEKMQGAAVFKKKADELRNKQVVG